MSDLLSADEKFLLSDLKENHAQGSWDWPADERFAEHLGCDSEYLMSETINSVAVAPIRAAVATTWKKVTQRRLRALRGLVRKGLAESYWMGTGWGGKTDFGITRVRMYDVKDCGR